MSDISEEILRKTKANIDDMRKLQDVVKREKAAQLEAVAVTIGKFQERLTVLSSEAESAQKKYEQLEGERTALTSQYQALEKQYRNVTATVFERTRELGSVITELQQDIADKASLSGLLDECEKKLPNYKS